MDCGDMWRANRGWLVIPFLFGALGVVWWNEVWPILHERQGLQKPRTPHVVPPITEIDREYLKMMYEEQAEHARLHEELRGTATGFFMALIAGLLAWAVGDGNIEARCRIVGPLIVTSSLIGAVLNAKHYERFQMHLSRLKGFRKSLEKVVWHELTTINDNWEKFHDQKNPNLSKISLHSLWNIIYVVTIIVGVITFIYGFCYKGPEGIKTCMSS